jgi:uncharacterized protein
VVRVKVIEVDLKRKRIALSMRMGDSPGKDQAAPRREPPQPAPRVKAQPQPPAGGGAFAEAFARAKRK